MSRADDHHGRQDPPKQDTEWPWGKTKELTPREQVVQILAEGIWEMVLAGKAPRRSARARPAEQAVVN